MNQKIVGAVMIISAFAYSGVYIAKTKRERVMALRELNAALGLLYAELGTRLTPIAEAASRLSTAEGRYAPLFFERLRERMSGIGDTRFSEIWSGAARETFVCLERDELDGLCALGAVLGTYELSDQLSTIELCRESIGKRAQSAESELEEKERTSIGVCSVLGVLAAVALI